MTTTFFLIRHAAHDDVGSYLASLGNGFLTYLRTRSADHWLFFAAGIIVGLIVAG